MGYLDKDTVVVDAVLTKKGREIISAGGTLDVRTFTVADTGVDYTLWNPDHPSGSAYYGEAIEALPQLEATPHASYTGRNKLISLGRSTIMLPSLQGSIDPTIPKEFTTPTPEKFTLDVIGWSGQGGGMQVLIQNTAVVTCTTGKETKVSGNALQFISEQEITTAAAWELLGPGPSYTFSIEPQLQSDTLGASTTITFIHSSGAYLSYAINVAHNKDIRPRISTQATKG